MSIVTHAVIWQVTPDGHLLVAIPFGTMFGTVRPFAERYIEELRKEFEDAETICGIEFSDSGDIVVKFHCEAKDALDFATAVLRNAWRFVANERVEWDRRIELQVH